MSRVDNYNSSAMLRVISAKQAADRCNISLSTWRRLQKMGVGPAPIRLSARRIGWRVQDVDNYINKNRAQHNALPSYSSR